ncbi:ABC transporter ATP-binding protein uup [Pirellulimonas nuda]|uniref:ATP-binding protein Uup n=1 Tax=Pirellulimonas nuda TaxID=2528009 RepID=A0A518DEF7_9BACT|nr:ATP-binding cassette domain-containing protein [Pirellulimonas nuda]QDU89861.1 ABC transporter ATP-binding protein uup [Pirellulimonas nuda]
MALVQLNNISIGFRGPTLLDDVTCRIEPGQRIGLVGRNGAGKTTLMKLLSGALTPDHGERWVGPGVRVAQLPQNVPEGLAGTIADVVSQAAHDPHDAEAWRSDHRVERLLTQMSLDGDRQVAQLSSGMKRRVLLAQTIISEPDVLLLDEPTNHLDLEAIDWLENFLLRWPATLLFVTHDRAFLQNLATRILEIDRGRLFDWSCDYPTFLERKEAALEAEEKQNALFDKRLAEEEVWLRRGVKARRARNEGRVRALMQMRDERSQRRAKVGTARIEAPSGAASGALVAKVEGVSFAFPNRTIVDDFSTTIMRGDKIGLIGPNGAGKTTLLKLLLGQLKPQSGSVKLGTKLQVAYFDQLRQTLDENATVQDNLGAGGETLTIDGKPRHVLSYLQDFLFSPERSRTLVKVLSGGERNRLLLARLFSKPANVLVMDEPTNDLDIETLELLESRLVEFEGTLLLVSHDRAFLNNVVASTMVFEPEGVCEYVGGYDDWVRQRKQKPAAPAEPAAKKTAKAPAAPAPKKQKLSYQDQRDLQRLPARIEKLEAEIAKLHEAMAEPGFYQQPSAEIAAAQADLSKLDAELAGVYQRWEALEMLANT